MKKIDSKSLLIVFIIVFAILIIYRIAAYKEPSRVPLKYVKGQSFIKPEEIKLRMKEKNGETGFRKDLLYKKLDAPVQITRNIFAPLYTPPPPVKKPPTPHPPSQPEVKVPTPEEVAIEKSKAELKKFKYLGFLNKGGINEAFLSKDNELISAKKGEIIKGRYLIKDISPIAVVIQDKETQIEEVVNLSGG